MLGLKLLIAEDQFLITSPDQHMSQNMQFELFK